MAYHVCLKNLLGFHLNRDDAIIYNVMNVFGHPDCGFREKVVPTAI